MAYFDGFVAAVPAANKDAYVKHASDAVPVFKEFGTQRLVETWGDDVPAGKVTDFQRTVKATPDEVIVFSWMEYADRAARDAAGAKMMSDPRMQAMGDSMPFDAKRMIYGGFSVLLDKGTGERPGYVDGSLIAVPTANKQSYTEHTKALGDVILEHGATRVVDGWGDDVPDGEITDFRGGVQATPEETVVFTWIEWPSKDVRDAAWEKIYTDPRMHEAEEPYDNGRRVFGGFRPVVDA